MGSSILYERVENPFGKSWEYWAAEWCKWMYSIPKQSNPSLDDTGKHCSINQTNEHVWFLTGTFGNTVLVNRRVSIPAGKAIFFPILVKEDSFIEDSDLNTELELSTRSTDATNKVLHLEANIDGRKIEALEQNRAASEVYDLVFPENNVYNVQPGKTRSVCDGYWLFIKPFQLGKHTVYFRGETLLAQAYTLDAMRNSDVYSRIHQHIDEKLTFKLEVLYEITIG
jgi:hypothetical protein